MSQLSYNLVLANLSWYFLKHCLSFILRETTPEILGPWEELEFTAMGTILLMSLNFLHLVQQILSLFFPQHSRIGLDPHHLACTSIQIEW